MISFSLVNLFLYKLNIRLSTVLSKNFKIGSFRIHISVDIKSIK